MGYWGWRPLMLLFSISVWVIGCTPTPDPLPTESPTGLPLVTLFVRTAVTVTPSSAPGLPSVPTPYIERTPRPGPDPTDTPSPALPETPVCYEAPENNILCLGQIENQSSGDLMRVAVLVALLDRDGIPFREQEVIISQRVIPAGEMAPYHALFAFESEPPAADLYGGVIATLLRAENSGSERLKALVVQGDHGEEEGGHYVVSAQVYNPDLADMDDVRLVVTLYNGQGRLAGYRVLQLESLAAGARVPVRVEVAAVPGEHYSAHHVHAEGMTEDAPDAPGD